MSTISQRKFQSKYAHVTAKVVGIFLAIIGIYFIAIIRGETDARNAKCSEKTTGVVSDVKASGSKYLNTIEYVAEDIDCAVTVESKKDLGAGTQIEVNYEPLTPKHVYIEGVSKTGTSDVVEGLIMILVGGAFVAAGVFLKKMDKPRSQDI